MEFIISISFHYDRNRASPDGRSLSCVWHWSYTSENKLDSIVTSSQWWSSSDRVSDPDSNIYRFVLRVTILRWLAWSNKVITFLCDTDEFTYCWAVLTWFRKDSISQTCSSEFNRCINPIICKLSWSYSWASSLKTSSCSNKECCHHSKLFSNWLHSSWGYSSRWNWHFKLWSSMGLGRKCWCLCYPTNQHAFSSNR